MIPYGRQDIDDSDVEAVVAVLRSDFLTQGPAVPKFEETVANHVGAAHALAMNSATSALHVAYLALGVGPGDWVWTTSITFIATANAALYCGAKVDFVDIDPVTYNMSVAALEAKLVVAEREGRLPKLVVPVHLCGQSCDMAGIAALAKTYGFRVVEDASHAIGGKYLDEFVGNCRYSDICIFSFHPVKIVTTAEGGMALTNDRALADKMALLRSHGMTRDTSLYQGENEGGWYYEQIDLGFNYRLTDLQAALGTSQMARIDRYVARRHAIAQRYGELFADVPITLPEQAADTYSAYHLYPIRVPADRHGAVRAEVYKRLRELGIGVNVHYIPVHTQPYYQAFGFRKGDFPLAESYYAEAISLPMYPTMTDAQQDEVVAAVKQALAA